MRLEDFIKRADELLALASSVLGTTRRSSHLELVDETQYHRFRSSCLSFLLRIFGGDSPYYKEFDKELRGPHPHAVQRGQGILMAAREDMAGGWLQTTKGLVSAEIFSDFIEMAKYLLEEDYKDPSAVIIGSVLEEHLRQLCYKYKIDTEIINAKGNKISKKTDTINSDIARANIYGKLDQKNVTAWLDLRNKAAHGKYAEYTKEQVVIMLQGLTEFMARVYV